MPSTQHQHVIRLPTMSLCRLAHSGVGWGLCTALGDVELRIHRDAVQMSKEVQTVSIRCVC